jgi:hypothetical protein
MVVVQIKDESTQANPEIRIESVHVTLNKWIALFMREGSRVQCVSLRGMNSRNLPQASNSGGYDPVQYVPEAVRVESNAMQNEEEDTGV